MLTSSVARTLRQQGRRGRLGVCALLCLALQGCLMGPRALESTHADYNEATRRVGEEQMLMNLVRARYNDSPQRIDVASITAQYEAEGSAEARPFFATEATDVFGTFSRVLPFVGGRLTDRPTLSLSPLDDPDTIRGLFTVGDLDGVIFLAETGYPLATVFRLWGESLNGLPNGLTASGPPRETAGEFARFQRAAVLLQQLKDRGLIQFARVEKLTEIGTPLPEASLTAAAQVDAARNGYEYRQRPDRTWALVRKDRRLELRVSPEAHATPEMQELGCLLGLQPGLPAYEVTASSARGEVAGDGTVINLSPRSAIQAAFYLSHGVVVPPVHYDCGLVRPTYGPDGEPFDWQQVTAGLFTVHHSGQHCRPKHAYVAVKYRGYWFYLDDRDADSKITFSLMLMMTRVNLLGVRKGGPTLTLPVGR